VIIENVLGVGRDRGSAVQRCKAALEELGYEVVCAPVHLHPLGAAQTRTRHVLVATREWLLDVTYLREAPGRNVEWAIGDLDQIDGHTLMDTAAIPAPANQRRMDWLLANKGCYNLPNRRRPPCHRGDHSYKSMYGQLQWDRPAQTITSGFGSMGQGRFVHPSAARTLTPHEAARLQFLPDFMDFGLVDHRQWLATMIGNAAPPVLTIAIVEALIEQGLLRGTQRPEAESPASARVMTTGAPTG
jgi:DNA (cytosine-5)-methyltransferase 1